MPLPFAVEVTDGFESCVALSSNATFPVIAGPMRFVATAEAMVRVSPMTAVVEFGLMLVVVVVGQYFHIL